MVDAAAEKKAQDIVLLDVRKVTSLADYFVICTATSERQLRAVAEGVEEALDGVGLAPLHREGKAPDGWMLLDYGDVVVHIFAPTHRDYYKLEELWEAATTVVRVQ
ncbi:MAG: ribosome silencing factor [Chloroflexota bacterium]